MSKSSHRPIMIFLAAVVFWIGLASTGVGGADACELRIEADKGASQSELLLEWRKNAYDATHKEWLRAVKECLSVAGLIRNDTELSDWLRAAGQAGNSDAFVMLGILGIQNAKDAAEVQAVLVWFRKAKEMGNDEAALYLKELEKNPYAIRRIQRDS